MVSQSLAAAVACAAFSFAAVSIAERDCDAEDRYFRVRLADLELTEGKLPPLESPPRNELRSAYWWLVPPHVKLDHEGEAVISSARPLLTAQDQLSDWWLVVCAPEGRDVTGRIWLFDPDGKPVPPFRFRIAAARGVETRRDFLRAKLDYYDFHLRRGYTGAAWYRHVVGQVASELGVDAGTTAVNPADTARLNDWSAEHALNLFTGQRALAENMALDRQARAPANVGPATVHVDSIRGITIPEFDWKPLLPANPPPLDPLAAILPADQHVVFFPSFAAVGQVARESRRYGVTWSRLASDGGGDDPLERYQKQLGVSLDLATHLLGPALVRSVALTGGDPYFDLGTDVAILFDSPQAELLRDAIAAATKAALSAQPQVIRRAGKVRDVDYEGYASADRSVSSYVARIGDVVVLSNSTRQIELLAQTSRAPDRSLAKLDEYSFFRQRYRRDDPSELALLFISDATLRRWCGPRWRIAALRRARALAELAELQAASAERIVPAGDVLPQPLLAPRSSIDLGELTLSKPGVHSSIYNTLHFTTPLGEVPVDLATSAEIAAYETWRSNYERNWRWAFDPIGLRLSKTGREFAADLTILPLIANTDYRSLVSLTRGASVPPGAGDRHAALLQAVVGINREDNWVRFLARLGDPNDKSSLDWIGSTASVYLDPSPFWSDLLRSFEQPSSFDWTKWSRANAYRLPLGIQLEIRDRASGDDFLKRLRMVAEQFGKPHLRMESRTYRDQAYTRVAVTPAGEALLAEKMALHVANLSDAIVATISEETLHKAIDRRLDRARAGPANAAAKKPESSANSAESLPNAILEVDALALDVGSQLAIFGDVRRAQFASWKNLPILNHWKRTYPDRDPVEVHFQVFGTRLACPSGGKYVWNEELDSLESTAVGHPARPRVPRLDAPFLSSVQSASLGLTFELGGLRAQLKYRERETPAEKPKP